MSNDLPRVRLHPVTQDMPLPGNYPCLTLQLNLTTYAPSALHRWILTVREPTLGIEVWRSSVDTTELTPEALKALATCIDQAVANMGWLQHGANH